MCYTKSTGQVELKYFEHPKRISILYGDEDEDEFSESHPKVTESNFKYYLCDQGQFVRFPYSTKELFDFFFPGDEVLSIENYTKYKR